MVTKSMLKGVSLKHGVKAIIQT